MGSPLCVNLEQVTTSAGTAFQLTPDPSVTDVAGCAYVLESSADYNQGWSALGALSIDDAQSIGLSIGVVWAIAWGFKVLVRLISSDWSSENES